MVSNNRKKITGISLICLFACFFLGAYEYAYTVEDWINESQWNRKLLDLKIGDNIGDFANAGIDTFSILASSCLKPEGQKRILWVDEERGAAHMTWTSVYDPYCAYDNNLNTAWSEGVPGDGVGEVLIYPLCDNDRIENENLRIFTGYAKSKDLWLKNNRPRNVKIFILKSVEHGANMVVSYPKNITVIDEQYATLKDVFDWQPLPVEKSKITFENRKKSKDEKYSWEERRKYSDQREEYMIGIQILSVYPGTKYQDTLISEISYDNEENPGNYYDYDKSILTEPIDW